MTLDVASESQNQNWNLTTGKADQLPGAKVTFDMKGENPLTPNLSCGS